MKLKHVLSGDQFTRNDLEKLFKLVDKMRKQERGNSLAGKIVASLFFETSTRTRLSFESAVLKLGGQVLSMADASATSSTTKGESLSDMVKVVSGYCDAIILRHPQNGAAEEAAKVSAVPIINAGDGYNEHPTQALMDLYTMQRELGKIDGLKMAFLVDFRYQRNIHSLVSLFGLFKNLQLYFVSPPELRLPENYKAKLDATRVKYRELPDLNSVISEIDILYVARVFKERFSDTAEYERLKKSLHIDQALVNKMKPKSAILHVMPRVYEIDPEVDSDPRAAYFRQAKNGLYLRMALLQEILGQ